MARQVRREYEGAIYHVMSRGDRREAIFWDDADRENFLKTLGEACGKAGWQVHAFCLMGNHFHAVIETPDPTLVAGMKWMLGTYTQRFNGRHKVRGHLFAGRYKALLVDGSHDCYLRQVSDYVHLNPVRAGMIGREEELSAYRWSSYPEYLKKPRERAPWLRVDRVLGELGIIKDSMQGRREFRRYMEDRAREDNDNEEWKDIRQGWKFGAEDFADRLAEIVEPTGMPESYSAKDYGELMACKGRRITGEEISRQGRTME
jgi:REP element-mobilizing transposase RayT